MVGVTKIQRGNAGYWIAAVAEGGEDYYTKPGEAPGRWVGQLAGELELSGDVDPAGYGAILEGRDPKTGAQLVQRPPTRVYLRPDGRERRAEPVLGYDVRFSAPKSVSLIYALGDEQVKARITSVLEGAVRDGLSYLEAEACMVQRGKGGTQIEPGRGFVGMAFRHRMSRSGDPALHVHVVVANLTRALSDGRWLTLASPKGRSALWPHAKSAGVVFQTSLRAGFLREFGFEFEAVRNGAADLRGVPREAIEGLSSRSREIATWLERHGLAGVKAAQVAAYRTRAAKDYDVDADRRAQEWIDQLAPYGLTPQWLAAEIGKARPREPRAITEADFDAALAKLEQTTSHFDRRQLLWALCDQLPDGADPGTLSAAFERLLASERIVCVHESHDPLGFDTYTTPRIAELEGLFIEGALGGVDAGVTEAPHEAVEAVLDRHPYLGTDQREMVLRLTTGGEAVVPVSAWPGTGKTTALAAAREAWEEAGFSVIGVATARTASGELTDAGVPATSIRAMLIRAEEWRARGVGLGQGTVILVDEANTTSTPDLEELRVLAEGCEGKLVLIGDPRQLGAIGPGGLFSHLTRTMEPVTLRTIRRQRAPEDRKLVELIHEGRGSEALDLLRTQGRMIVGDDLPSTLHGLLADWHRDFATGADVVMIARRNRDVDYLNEAGRVMRSLEGALGDSEVIVGERPYAVGDRVQTRINTPDLDNRERWDVIGADAAARTLSLRRVGGDQREVVLGPAYLDDRTPDGEPALDYAYAITYFNAESKTFDRGYPFLDAGASIESAVVVLSRGREMANVYAVAASELLDPELGPATRDLSDVLHDVREAIEREGADYAAAEVSVRRRVEAMGPADLAQRHADLAEVKRGDPERLRRERLGRDISEVEATLAKLTKERAALEAMPEPDAAKLAWARAAEATSAQGLDRRRAELRELPEGERRAAPDPSRRLEAVLVEQRIEQLARREVAAARIDTSTPIYKALGPYPADSDEALAWGKGAHAIALYRQRHGVRDTTTALGGEPRGAAARAERLAARQRVEAVQRRLGRAVEVQLASEVGHSR